MQVRDISYGIGYDALTDYESCLTDACANVEHRVKLHVS